MNDPLPRAQAEYATFTDRFQSVVLATIDEHGEPHASYAPCVIDERRHIWCFVSGLSKHTGNLEATGKANAFFVEDEGQAEVIFARKRLNYVCRARVLSRDAPEFERVAARFIERFGDIAGMITSMPDFRPVELVPQSGSFVIGFGAAFEIRGDRLDELVHLKGGGSGHGKPHGHGAGGGHGHGHGGHGHGHGGHGHGGHEHGGHGHGGHGHGGHGHGGHEHGGHGDGGHGHGGHGHGDHAHGHAGGAPAGKGLTKESVQSAVDHMNADHADALLRYAHTFARRTDARAARLVGLDERGMDLRIDAGAGDEPLRIDFPRPIASTGELRTTLVEMATRAREAAAGT